MKLFTKSLLAAMMSVCSLGASALTLADLEHLYIIGNATPSDWVNTCSAPLTQSGDKFVYEGGLISGEMKFITTLGQWTPAVMPFNGGTEINDKGVTCDIYVTETGDPDNKWNITKEGNYRLTIDTKAETLTAEYLGELPACIYALGEATSGRDSNSGLYMFKNAEGKYVFEGIVNPKGDHKDIKFTTTRGDWDKVEFLVPTEVNLNDNVNIVGEGTYPMQKCSEGAGNLKDWFWGVDKAAIYRFTVDVDALTLTVKKVSNLPGEFEPADVTHLYMNGMATGSFDSNAPGAELTALGNGVFEWKGELDYAAQDGDDAHANKLFKFLTGIGDWNAVWYLIPAQAQADGYIEQVEAGKVYDLQACSWIGGRSGIDAFFGLTEGAKGEYTLKVDVPNMKLHVISGSSSIERVEAADADEVLEYYTIDGREISADNLSAGIYLVRTTKGVCKIAIH